MKLSAIFSKKKIFYCVECGAIIRLEEKRCNNCGVDNIKRKEALEALEKKEKSIEKKIRAKMQQKIRYKKWSERQMDALLEKEKMMVKSKKMQILIGSWTLEDKKKWIEEQYREGKSFREIGEELGEGMITVRRYIDPDSQNDKRETVAPLQEKRDSYTRRIENSNRIQKKPDTLYLMRFLKEVNESGKEVINKICANCGEKNNFKETDGNTLRCLKCGANHYIRE